MLTKIDTVFSLILEDVLFKLGLQLMVIGRELALGLDSFSNM